MLMVVLTAVSKHFGLILFCRLDVFLFSSSLCFASLGTYITSQIWPGLLLRCYFSSPDCHGFVCKEVFSVKWIVMVTML